MTLAELLAEERRARLAAERLLQQKQAELHAANRKLGQHALQLSHEISEKRAEVAFVRDEHQRAMQKIDLVEGQLWRALESIRDGFAMFDDKHRLEIANPAYLGVFEGVDSIAPGADYAHILEILAEEGIVDLQGEDPGDWRSRMPELR